MSDTKPVRSSEQLDWQRLATFLREAMPQLHGEMEVEQFPGGHSNLTYLIRLGENELVLRRPPFGPVPPRAHDMAREYRVLAAVHPHFSLAPEPLMLCEDTSVIGSVFYVMERRRGVVIRAQEPEGMTPELRARISESVIDTLADLHALGPMGVGKPEGFVARQVSGWTERWHGSKTSDVPEMEKLARWLAMRVPADTHSPALVHGDYKLDNVMLDASDLSRIVGVVDWEMSAAGDPLVDVGILLCYWVHVASADNQAVSTVTAQPGWFGRDQILQCYASRSGRDVSNIAFYEVFALFKLAVVVQQIFARYHRGQTDDPRFASLDRQVAMLALKAMSLTTNPS
jgi:aminoglycoside phosphotransferase (APT) family kinase protein